MLSYAVLIAVAIAILAWAVAAKRRTEYTWGQAVGYLYAMIYSRVVWRTRISGPLPVAKGQGAVIVCNHISGIDPAFIALTNRRPIRWMVAKEYYQMPLVGSYMRTMIAIPVNRGGIDTAATKTAIRTAQSGGLVGMFPEGRINFTDQLLLPGRPGAALVALKARVPVVPCFVRGSPAGKSFINSLLMTAKVHLQVGRPMDLSSYYGREGDDGVLEEVTRKMLVEIARLGGRPDFVPELAGRRWKPGTQ